jgi:hypothetical protein
MRRLFLVTAVLALLCTGLVTGAAMASGTPLGTAAGGAAVYYNSALEVPANIAYIRSQASATNTAGAVFNFPNTAPWPAYGPSHPFQVHPDQFGLDFIVPAATATIPVPSLNAYDWNPSTSQAVQDGQIMWAINGYASGAVVNSLFRGNAIEGLTMVPVGPIGTPWAVQQISGWLVSDGYIHWYSDFNNNGDGADDVSSLSSWGWSDKLWFEGTLTYNNDGSGMDFYGGTISVSAVPVPEPMSIMLGIMGLGSVAGFRRLRRK